MNPSNISKTITKIIINLLNKHDIKYKYLCTDSGRVPRYEIHLMPLRKKLICYNNKINQNLHLIIILIDIILIY